MISSFVSYTNSKMLIPSSSRTRTDFKDPSVSSWSGSIFLHGTRQTSSQLIVFHFRPISVIRDLPPIAWRLSRLLRSYFSLFYPLFPPSTMNMCVSRNISDSHTHLSKYMNSTSPRKWLYNCTALLKYTLEVTGTESSGKALLGSSRASRFRLGFPATWSRNRNSARFPFSWSLHRNRSTGHIIARQISRLLCILFRIFSPSSSLFLSLSLIHLFSPRHSLLISFIRSRMLPFSPTGFICTLTIFFGAFCIKKTFSGQFLFSSWKSWDPLQSLRLKIPLC